MSNESDDGGRGGGPRWWSRWRGQAPAAPDDGRGGDEGSDRTDVWAAPPATTWSVWGDRGDDAPTRPYEPLPAQGGWGASSTPAAAPPFSPPAAAPSYGTPAASSSYGTPAGEPYGPGSGVSYTQPTGAYGGPLSSSYPQAPAWPSQAPPPWPGGPPLDTLGREPRRRPGLALLLPLALALALLAGLVGGGAGYLLAERRDPVGTIPGATLATPGTTSPQRPPDSVAGVAQRVLPSVVQILVRSGTDGGTGSGFVIRRDGYILTNNHVIASAVGSGGAEIGVKLSDGRSVRAQVVGRSQRYDLAVIKVPTQNLPEVALGDSDSVAVGDPVLAVGSPLGLAGTVTSGIISARNRPVAAGRASAVERSYINALQTDAAVNPGNSGGPLVDLDGRVIGVNSAIAGVPGGGGAGVSGNIGLGFAIPMAQARRTAEQIIRDGKATYPIMGVTLEPAYSGEGARIAAQDQDGGPGVRPGGPADGAGLRVGDVITRLADRLVSSDEELIVAVSARQPGETVSVVYRRDGREATARVTLGAASE